MKWIRSALSGCVVAAMLHYAFKAPGWACYGFAATIFTIWFLGEPDRPEGA